MGDERLADEVNRLYWESESSVSEIANRLGISRRALYEALSARPAGMDCPGCGAGLVYANRSRREAGQPACPACGLEPDIAALREATAEAGPAMRRDADRREAGRAAGPERAAARPRPESAHTREQERAAARPAPLDVGAGAFRVRALLIGGAALAGIAVGAIVMLLLRRRA
ncbi:MAG TPA: hypothetical protein VF158_17770 [Longimicrobiales bacterium]